MTSHLRVAVALGLAVLAASGSSRSHASHSKDEAQGHGPLTERLTRPAPRDAPAGLSSEKHLGGVRRAPASEFPGIAAFDVVARLESLRRFPCRECHTAPLVALRARAKNERRAHWEIALRHAAAPTMTCATCHQGGRMESLGTLGGQPVELDHAYRVCAQCHPSQVRDWAGGAHGKRVGGWAPPRVVVSCPACHDPHQPRLDKRWPSRSSRVVTTRD